MGRLPGIKKFFGMSAGKERYASQCSADEKRSDAPCCHFASPKIYYFGLKEDLQ
jgi:hypothetical protein